MYFLIITIIYQRIPITLFRLGTIASSRLGTLGPIQQSLSPPPPGLPVFDQGNDDVARPWVAAENPERRARPPDSRSTLAFEVTLGHLDFR
jgi:hypothetical protein